MSEVDASGAVAVISMAGRFPGACDVATFWANLCRGVESISRFDVDDGGVDATDARPHGTFVGAEGLLEGTDLFAHELFSFTPRDAELTDPQHRVCLEVVWEALDTAGYIAEPPAGSVGVFLGATMSSYLVRNLLPHRELVRDLGGFRVLTRNDKDFLPATVSYKLGLSGPSMAIGTSCSSSLVAVHQAAQSLLTGECDMAAAGAVSLLVPARQGHYYREDAIYSPDGHCRAFGTGASGTVGGSGVAVVLLKRLADAERDGDHVHAVVLGSAVNNDGAAKAGFTAPGVAGQARVIAEAHAVAGISPREVGLIEAHGTGTSLGDMIEIEALTEAFRLGTTDRGFCAIGSVKTNIGHLDAAAGAAGLIKAVLAVEHGVIPATLHADPPNPALDLPSTPFRPAVTTVPWPRPGPRTAGISAFGIGGTNVHAVVREAARPAAGHPPLLPLLVSATDASTLADGAERLARWLEGDGSAADLRAVCRTLMNRSAGPHRLAVIAADAPAASALLRSAGAAPGHRFTGTVTRPRDLVLLVEGPPPEPGTLTRLLQDPLMARHHASDAADGVKAVELVLAGALANLGVSPNAIVGIDEGGRHLSAVLDIPWSTSVPAGAEAIDLRALTRDTAAIAADLETVVADVWTSGVDVDWARHRRCHPGPRAQVPARSLRRRRFWIDAPAVPDDVRGPDPDRMLDGSLDELLDGRGVGAKDATPVPATADPSADGGLLDELCSAIALATLRAGGLPLDGRTFAMADVRRTLAVLPPLRQLADFLVRILVEDGALVRTGEVLLAGPRLAAVPTTEVAAAAVLDQAPGLHGTVDLLLHCAAHYPEALSRPGAALATLYPDGRGDLLERTLGAVPASAEPPDDTDDTDDTGDTGDAVAALARVARRLQRGSKLRVLEVGAGGGRLTAALAAALNPGQVQYTVTDVSRTIIDRLKDHVHNSPVAPDEVRFGVLDITTDPRPQGYAPRSYDLVVGLDVLHTVPHLPTALGHLADLLAPGGLLGIVETTARHRWLSLVFGLSAAWWHFADDLRTDSPLLDADGWRRAIAGVADEQRVCAIGAGAAMVLARRSVGATATSTRDGVLSGLPLRQPDVADWTYLPGWRRVPTARSAVAPTRVGSCLVLADGPLGAAVIEVLSARGVPSRLVGRQEVTVPGTEEVDPKRVQAVLDDVDPEAVLHLYPACAEWPGARPEEDQEVGLHALIAVAQAIGRRSAGRLHLLLAVTRGAQQVVGEDLTRPGQATAAAASAIIDQEYPALRAAVLDLPDPCAGHEASAALLVDELLAGLPEPRVAVRNRLRWLPTVEAVRLPPADGHVRGLHVICGGTGGLGLALAEHFAAAGSPVVLTSRTALPPRRDWPALLAGDGLPDRERSVLERLSRIEAAGGTVVHEQADVTDVHRMREVLTRATGRFGAVRGVVHAAGVVDPGGVLQRRSRIETIGALSAKLQGVTALAEALATHDPAYVVLCSSIGSVLHKLKFGEVGYLAGNEFLNAWAAYRSGSAPNVLTIAWTDWVEAGMWARARSELTGRRAAPGVTLRDDADLLLGLSDTEGVELFDRIVTHRPGPVVLVSTQPLADLLAIQSRYRPGAAPEGAYGADGRSRPSGSLEERVSAIWTELLGVEGFGIDDDFFDLGGDSLVALRVLSRIREETGIDLPFDGFFDTPTVSELARLLAAAATGPAATGGGKGTLAASGGASGEEVVI